ncbi:MAG: efflux transporter outer membrane subunit [Rickettsiales bacterium]
MHKFTALFATTMLTACSLSPDHEPPKMDVPAQYKEQTTSDVAEEVRGEWKVAEPNEKADRGEWWKIFADADLNALQAQAIAANHDLKAAAARVEAARGVAGASVPSLIPDIDIGGNVSRTKQSPAAQQSFGGGGATKPYTLYSAGGVASYEADIFGRVRDNYQALLRDADAQEALYKSTLLALQADVAQHYFNLRALDAERQLLRDTITIREEAHRIMQRRYELGESGAQDVSRTIAELASVRAELVALDRRRAELEHALAVLVGTMPSQFTFEEAPLAALPPKIPAGLPSSLLERRPDIVAAQNVMAAANRRVGVARTAFFPRLLLNASAGFESASLSDLFLWSSRSWTLGQMAGQALTMPIFDSGRNLSRLDTAKANYTEAVELYKQQVLVAFRDVETSLVNQRLMAEQAFEQDAAARAATRTTELSQRRYDEGEVDYFEVVSTQRDALTAQRAAVQTRGQRFIATVTLIRALGGGWDDLATSSAEPKKPLLD